MPVAAAGIPRSALRYRPIPTNQTETKQPPLVARASRPSETVPPFERVVTRPSHPLKRQQTYTALLWLGSGMIVALCAVLLAQAVLNWCSTTWDDVHYGYPRTFQTDAFVGHPGEAPGNPSHFIALNLRGRIEIIEFPGGDATHAKIYLGPQLYGSDADRVPVTLQFLKTNQLHHPDILLRVQGSPIAFHNTGTTFQQKP